jgi:heat shock protein HslJ
VGEAGILTVDYVADSTHYGDLDGDGVEDAIVFLLERGGGAAANLYVATQLNQDGQPVDSGSVLLESNIEVISTAIEEGQVLLKVTTRGPGDADCCASYRVERTFALQEGRLAEVGEPTEPVRVSAADLTGSRWSLLELNYDPPAVVDTEVTINFQDGQISGFGGCNTYKSSFNLGDDNPFVMTTTPTIATRQACPDPILKQETAYLTALDKVSQWGYEFGQLALYYADDQGGLGRLLFGLQTEAEPKASLTERLTASTWAWVRLTDPMQQVEIVSPENYRLTFLADGSLQIKADCNQATAAYNASEDGSLSVTPGVTTLAVCPPGSRSEELIQKLTFAARYFFQDGHLLIDLVADGGTLEFRP